LSLLEVWEEYKTLELDFWCTEELQLSDSFFESDVPNNVGHTTALVYKIVVMLLGLNKQSTEHAMFFLRTVKPPEHKCFYSFQLQQENTHMETYCQILSCLDTWQDAGAMMAKYQKRTSAREIIAAMEDVTDDGFGIQSLEKWMDPGFPEILLKYAMRKYIFAAALHYLLYKLSGVLKLEKPAECWCRIQMDCNRFVSFASFLYTHSKNKVSLECMEDEMKKVTQIIQNFVDDEIFNHDSWIRVLAGGGDRLVTKLSKLREEVIDFTNYSVKDLVSIMSGVGENEDPTVKKYVASDAFPILGEIISLSSVKKEKSKEELEKEMDDIFTMDSDF